MPYVEIVVGMICATLGLIIGSALRGARDQEMCQWHCDYYKAVKRMQTPPDNQIDGNIDVGF